MRLLLKTLQPKPAVDLEAEIARHVLNDKIPADYEAKVRQLAYNLRKTPDLRRHPPNQLVLLTDAEMARGTDVERWTQAFELELANEARLVNPTRIATTSLLKCRRCKSDRISTNQIQTRSSDEPMTLYCHCDDCSLRWKM